MNKIFGSTKKGYLRATGFALMLAVALLLPVVVAGCQGEMEQFQGLSPSSEFSVLSVPNVDLDVYIYAKQRDLTTIPADIVNMPHDIKVESVAIWGVPGDKDLVVGTGLTFDNEATAREVFRYVEADSTLWTLLRGTNLYIVKGTGNAASKLKNAITGNDFKNYDNSRLIEAANMLPKSVRAKLISIALAKPSKQLINFLGENINQLNLTQINDILNSANLEIFIAGLYSPNQINIARAAQVARGKGNLADLNLGLLVALKSGFPGIIVEPRIKSILTEQGLTEARIGEFSVYKGYWKNPYMPGIPVYARVEGNYVFLAISGQESYAQTLITSIYK
jgi:hypothetical protein